MTPCAHAHMHGHELGFGQGQGFGRKVLGAHFTLRMYASSRVARFLFNVLYGFSLDRISCGKRFKLELACKGPNARMNQGQDVQMT